MTIGKITSSQQDTAYVMVRPEDGTFVETHNGAAKSNYYLIDSVGERFTTEHWSDRIKIKIGNVINAGKVRVNLYDTPSKALTYFEIETDLPAGGSVIHVIFDPLPAGTYYLEIKKISGSCGISVVTDSTIHTAYKEGGSTSDWDIESKIMYVSDVEVERAVAVVDDEVDTGVTVTSAGSDFNFIKVGINEKAVCREGDSLSNGGRILNGCWFVEV
jgi:phosphoribosylpyrophosphate synthetase